MLFLLEKNIFHEYVTGTILLRCACIANSTKSLKVLIGYGYDINNDFNNPLLILCAKNADQDNLLCVIENIRILLSLGVDINRKNRNCKTILMVIIEKIIKNQIQPDQNLFTLLKLLSSYMSNLLETNNKTETVYDMLQNYEHKNLIIGILQRKNIGSCTKKAF